MLWGRRYSRREIVQLQKSPWSYHFSLQSLIIDNLRLGRQQECCTCSGHFGWPIILVIPCLDVYFQSSEAAPPKVYTWICVLCPSSLLAHKALYLVPLTIFCLLVYSNLLPLSRVLCLCISTNLATLLLSIMQQLRTEGSSSSRHRVSYRPQEVLKILAASSHHSIHHSFTPSLQTVRGRWRAFPNITF